MNAEHGVPRDGRRVVGQLRIDVLGGARSTRRRGERPHMGVDDGPAADEHAIKRDGALIARLSEEVAAGGQLHERVKRRARRPDRPAGAVAA